MKKVLHVIFIGIILFIAAKVLKMILEPICIIFTILFLLVTGRFKEIGKYYADLAFAEDQYGNVLIQYPANIVLIKKDSPYKYGNPDVTISAVTGKNLVTDNALKGGKIVCTTLGVFDKDHCIKAAPNYHNHRAKIDYSSIFILK